MTSGVSYPGASTPDPTVHRAPSNQLNQFAFVAGYLEAVGQQMLSAFTQVIVQALVGLVTGKSLPQLQAQLSGWGAALESAAEGAAEDIATIIDGTLGLGHTAEDLVTFLENTASDATSATVQFEDLLTDTTAPDIAALAVIINNASLGAGGFLTLLLDTGAANATVLAGTLNTAVSDASAAVADLATLLSAAGSATVTVLGALIAAASTDASGAVAELAAFVSGMGAGSMAALITAQNTANTAATSARADIDAVLSALGLSLPIASLSSYLSATESDASTAISNFGALLSATGAANVAALGTYLSTANSNASAAVTDITNLLSATGQADVAALSTFLTDTNNDAVASLGNWTTILSAMTLANAADLASYITGANTNANLAVTAIGSLISGVGGAAIADVVALINLIQQIIDAIANALGHPGTGHTPSQVQGYMEPIPPIVNGWTTALAELNLLNPLALIQQIPQSIPALVRGPDGGLTAVGTGLTRGVDGALTFVADGLTHLAKQDGGLLSLQQVTQHMVHVASVIGADVNAGVADVMDAGQKAHTALTGAVEQAGVTVEGDIVAGANAFGAVVSGTAGQIEDATVNAIGGAADATTAFGMAITTVHDNATSAVGQIEDAASVFAGDVAAGAANLGAQAASWMTQLAGLWGGAPPPPPPPGPPAPSQAMLDAAAAAAAAQALAAKQTAAIQSQLPHFYGGSGVAGTNIEQSLSGLTSLPAGFASVSTIAAVSGMYSTAAQSSSQTTSGIWSTSDQYAKYLFLRMNAAGTSYVYAKIQNNVPFTGVGNCEIGCVVAGTRHIFATFALPSTGNLVSNNVYTFEAAGNVFQLTGPGGLNESYMDGTLGGSPSVSQWDPDSTTHVYGYGGFGTDGTALAAASRFNTAGPFNFPIPGTMGMGDRFDVAGIGGGGAGLHGAQGGTAGTWAGAVPVLGIDITLGTTAITGVVGAGGTTGGGNGVSSAVVASGWAGLTAAGGLGNAAPTSSGAAAVNFVVDNFPYIGGTGGGVGPGDGSAGGGLGVGPGGVGSVWITPASLNVVGSLYSWAFYDSGPSAGPGGAFVATDETTASATYGQLATTTDQIDVNVSDRGMVQVFLGAEFYNTSSSHYAYVSFSLAGSNNVTAATMEGLGKFIKNGSSTAKFGEPFMVYNLAKGPTTFEMEFRTDGTGTGHFANRSIDVIPL